MVRVQNHRIAGCPDTRDGEDRWVSYVTRAVLDGQNPKSPGKRFFIVGRLAQMVRVLA